MSPTARTVDQSEVDRFSRIAAEWWDPKGKFKPLHKFNPARLGYLKREISAHFGRNADAANSFEGLTLVDIGCGGGLISEPMARLGATVTGIDPSETNIEVARLHAGQSGLTIDYRAETAEALDAAGDRFDVVLALEVIEHVADVQAFLETVSNLVRPGGLLVVATLNRTIKALGLAIIGAEYVLRWLPRGTHSWDKFVKPEEVEAPLQDFGLTLLDRSGIVFDPFRDIWKESRDTDVNYMVLATKPKA
ncbi:bifunctional 2-polyprenyl-6-hydroxyphenol methylase/3-demethylubiquinol 3-O-methyltransferase UbiG [Oryzibacter oryziterrae]|uniref:bifunctional 2-polyprenyl-6-hydroxyphenol methylase/3-demethylubiquinol 3-O-methyltransferase UbiG n=1 Tax=Oryzibacter oryziterrae TaxID=2766474 RepID=UPI001F02624B|nr:bifunctional 2-polyprenyl-6-hydroxyphenol methylase/3-demethylubiquinol 3-O-methyltransferase UbiG [Oryzibacter oryziterrae]